MFWTGLSLGIILGYGLCNILSGEFEYEAEIYHQGYDKEYDKGYRDGKAEYYMNSWRHHNK